MSGQATFFDRSPTLRAMDEAAGLIRSVLWRSNEPPPGPDGRSWSMACELRIWKRLVQSGIEPEELNGAISVLRRVHPDACRLTFLSNSRGSDLFERAVHLWRSEQDFQVPLVLRVMPAARPRDYYA